MWKHGVQYVALVQLYNHTNVIYLAHMHPNAH